jgi:hypothetical protein
MRDRWGLVVALLCTVGLVAAGPARAQEPGQVGGPPTLNLPRKDYKRHTSDVIVIGRGVAFNGVIEMVAWSAEKCPLAIEVESVQWGPLFSICGAVRPLIGPIELEGASFGIPIQHAASSQYDGPLATNVETVEAIGKKHGHRKTVAAVVGKPDAQILSRLGQTQPFAYWVAILPGCFSGKQFTARAFDSQGGLIGVTHAIGGAALCRRHLQF